MKGNISFNKIDQIHSNNATIMMENKNQYKNAYNTLSNSPVAHKKQKKITNKILNEGTTHKIGLNQKLNPYLKKFNIRRLTKTQQSTSLENSNNYNLQKKEYSYKKKSADAKKHTINFNSKNNSTEKQKYYLKNKNTIEKWHLSEQVINKLEQQNNETSKKLISKLKTKDISTNIRQQINRIQNKNQAHSLQRDNESKQKKTYFFRKKQNQRFQTEESTYKVRLTQLQKSPYKKYTLKVDNINSHHNTITNSLNQEQINLDDAAFQQKKKNYSFLTKFQLQQIQNFQIYYPGQRRIGSLRHFTDNNGNAKISIGDSIIYRYEIKGMLGQGSFGQVFKAYDHKKKENIALKIIKNTPKFNAQAKVQIKILQNALMHDPKNKNNIVRMKHAFVFRGHACITFQLLHINLYEFLKLTGFSGMSTDLIRRISIQILQGLHFFNKFDIIHCDLKPENILLKQQNKTGIKIIDVGSGCFQNQQIYTYIQSRFYRAPQIILGLRYTSAIDIWSFGCIICELYLGYPIFPGENQEQEILMFMEILGIPQQDLIDRGTRSRKFFSDYNPKIVPNSKGRIRTPGSKSLEKVLKGCDDKLFLQFILKCFKWKPQNRITAKQALLDQWILSGLPEQLRQQHRQSVINNHFC